MLKVAQIEIEGLRSEREIERSRTALLPERAWTTPSSVPPRLLEALDHIKAVIHRHAPGDAT